MEEGDLSIFEKAFIGVVEEPGMTYNVQETFNIEGYFRIKVTPVGTNLCLLEEEKEGEIDVIVLEDKEWIEKWFSVIRPWTLDAVDNERLTWIRCYGVPCHAWSFKFFDFITCSVGKLISMDVARILVRIKYSSYLNENFNMEINNNIFNIKLVEDMHGSKWIQIPKWSNDGDSSEEISFDEDEDSIDGGNRSDLGVGKRSGKVL